MGKKILLINPKFTEEVPIFNIPVPLVYLGSWLKARGYEVYIQDNLHSLSTKFPPVDLIGLTVMSTQIPNALSITKRVGSYVPVIWGGVHPTLYPEQVASSPSIHYVVVGEGEYPLLDILDGQAVGKIQRGREVSINEYPRLDWNLVRQSCGETDLRKVSHLTEFGISLLTSRGCPHRCTFCINSVLGIKYRRRSANLVIDDIRDALEQGIDRIQFEDEDFFADRGRVRGIIDGIKENNLKVKWAASARVSYFNKYYLGNIDFLKELRESGLYFIGTGAESGSERILNKVSKGISPQETLVMAECLSKAKIDANFSFMIGLPEETTEDYRKTLSLIDKIIRIDRRFYILGPQIYRPYPGSRLFEECVYRGLKIPNSLEEWSKSPYIHSEFSSNPQFIQKYYPWIDYKKDLTDIVFYATLMGLRPRNQLVTYILRLIGRIRCRLFWFRLPLLKKLYGILRGSCVERILRRFRII